MGQGLWPNLGGVQWLPGQMDDQFMVPTRGRDEMNKTWPLGLTEMAGKPPPSGGGGGVCWCAGEVYSLQPTLGNGGTHLENSQKYNNDGTIKLSWYTTIPKNFKF